MNGMLLAAGRGERMEPLSSWIPKPVLDVLGRPLLASALDHLLAAGCERLVANLHRYPARVAAAVRDASESGRKPLFSWEPRLLGGAGGLAAARHLLGTGDVLVANADVWADLDLTPLLAAAQPDSDVLALLPHPDPARWSSVLLDADGRVTAVLPPGAPDAGRRFLFTGFQLLGSRVVAALPPPPAEFAPVWDDLRLRGSLFGVLVHGAWREAGTPAAYRELVVEQLVGRSRIHRDASVPQSGQLERSWVGAGCTVGHEVTLVDTVVTADARVGAGCRLTRCVVAAGVTLGEGETLADALALPDGVRPLAG